MSLSKWKTVASTDTLTSPTQALGNDMLGE